MQINVKNIPLSKSPKEYATNIIKAIRTQINAANTSRDLERELNSFNDLKLGDSLDVVFEIKITKKKK